MGVQDRRHTRTPDVTSLYPRRLEFGEIASGGEPVQKSFSQPLDAEFAALMRGLEVVIPQLPKALQIRCGLWAEKLGRPASSMNDTFKRDRNLYADLLLRSAISGNWVEPLDRHPPEGPLRTLPKHIACSLRNRRGEQATVLKEVMLKSVPSSTPSSTSTSSLGSSTGRKSVPAGRSAGSRPQRQLRPASSGPAVSRHQDPGSGQLLRARVARLSAKNKHLLTQLGDLQAQNAQLALLGQTSTTPVPGAETLPPQRRSASACARTSKETRVHEPTQSKVSELAVENKLLWQQLAELRERNARLEDLAISGPASPGPAGSNHVSRVANGFIRHLEAAQDASGQGQDVDRSARVKESIGSDTSSSFSNCQDQLLDHAQVSASFRLESPPDQFKEEDEDGNLILLKASIAMQEAERDLRENHHIDLRPSNMYSAQEEGCTKIAEVCTAQESPTVEGSVNVQPSPEGTSDDEFLKYLDSFQTYAQQLFKTYADDPLKRIVDRTDATAGDSVSDCIRHS